MLLYNSVAAKPMRVATSRCRTKSPKQLCHEQGATTSASSLRVTSISIRCKNNFALGDRDARQVMQETRGMEPIILSKEKSLVLYRIRSIMLHQLGSAATRFKIMLSSAIQRNVFLGITIASSIRAI